MKTRMQSLFQKIVNTLKSLNPWQVFVIVFLLGFTLYIRISNLFSVGFYYDTVETEYAWAKYAYENGYGNFMRDYDGFFDYLPGGLWYGVFLESIARFLKNIIPGGGEHDFVFVMKFFNNIYDFLIASIIFLLAWKKGKLSSKTSLILATIVFSLPSLWIVSAIWGQFDSLIVLLGLVSILFLHKGLNQKNVPFWKSYVFCSGILFGIAFWTKIQVLIMLPVFLMLLFANKPLNVILSWILSITSWLLIIIGSIFIGFYFYEYAENYYPTLAILSLLIFTGLTYSSYKKFTSTPKLDGGIWIAGFISMFWPLGLIALIYEPLRFWVNLAGPFTKENVLSTGALNLWSLYGGSKTGSDFLFSIGQFGLSISMAGILIFTTLVAVLLFRYIISNSASVKDTKFNAKDWIEDKFTMHLDLNTIFIFLSIISNAYFLFMTKMHSRYQIWGIVFSLIPAFLIKNKKYRNIWIIGTVLMHITYSVNQMGVYSEWNADQTWMKAFFNIFSFNSDPLFVALNVIGFCLIYFAGFKCFSREK